MQQVFLEGNELGIPKRFEAVSLPSFAEVFNFNQRRTGFRSIYKYTAFIRITLQILLSNCEFLGLRLALFFKFKRDVSIFMAKYGILINHRILEIFQCCKD